MDIKDIRELSETDIRTKIFELKKDLLNLRFQLANHQLKNNQQVGQKKKIIARLNTVLREKIKTEVKKELQEVVSSN